MLRGSALPGSTGQQVPSRPVWLHDTHAPWQASAQQTPSVQKPEAQSVLFAQLVPFILRPQLPLMHCTPRPQSLFAVQAPKQSCLLTSHEYGEHTFGSAGAHDPAPSHVWMPVTAAPSQVPALQTVPMTYLRQAPCPSQVPSVPQLRTSDIGHVADERGGSPAGTRAHVPIEPLTSQRLQVSPHALSQQTPSTQNADWQSALHPQASPLTRCAPASEHFGAGAASPPSARPGTSTGTSALRSVAASLVPDEEPPHPVPKLAIDESATTTANK
jgi:hypothetical protein